MTVHVEMTRPQPGPAARRGALLGALALAIGLGLFAGGPGGRAAGAPPPPPNVVLLLTDDQPASNMGPLSRTRALIQDQGTTFNHAYISFPLCCPSRATILSGLYMHNHQVRGNGGTYGGWKRFRDFAETDALPVRLATQGYYSTQIGKYLNGYSAAQGFYVPPGWDEWYARLGGENKTYYDYSLIEQGPSGIPSPVYYGFKESDYSTDVFSSKALDFIERAPSIGQPFFLSVNFSAPHHPFTPAPRDIYKLAGGGLPVRLGFNERNISDKPRWLQREAHKRIGPGERAKIANEQRRRDETLLGVDNSVDQIMHALNQEGLLENTYVIFTSDNGLFRGEHRLTGGKYLPYEPSSHVPLIIRGPGIPAGRISNELVGNMDIAETFLDAAGIDDPGLDGRSLLPYAEDPSLRTTRPILLEGDTGPGRGIGPGNDPDLDSGAASAAVSKLKLAHRAGVKNLDQEKLAGKSQIATGDRAPAYRAIRTERYLYVIYATGDSELYDMHSDPGQLHSLARSKRYAPVRAWLFQHLFELVRCNGPACRAEIGEPPPPLPKTG